MPLQGYGWVGRDHAILPERTPSKENGAKTRRLPPPWPRRTLSGIGCPLCWAAHVAYSYWTSRIFPTLRLNNIRLKRLKNFSSSGSGTSMRNLLHGSIPSLLSTKLLISSTSRPMRVGSTAKIEIDAVSGSLPCGSPR